MSGDWTPGTPLYDRNRSGTGYMISMKIDRCDEYPNPDAARWSPDKGWRHAMNSYEVMADERISAAERYGVIAANRYGGIGTSQ